jgi:hypothetical protein
VAGKNRGAGVFRFPDSPAELQILAGQLILTADAEQAWPEGRSPVLALQTGTEKFAITLLSEAIPRGGGGASDGNACCGRYSHRDSARRK